MSEDIQAYNAAQTPEEQGICEVLANAISKGLPDATNKVWHAHPVWFLDGNPVVGYAKRKAGINLMFWSGQSFDEPGLKPEGSFKAAEIMYTHEEQINPEDLQRWLKKSITIQWDYKNIVKNRGQLDKLT